jgi:hypothetical protein
MYADLDVITAYFSVFRVAVLVYRAPQYETLPITMDIRVSVHILVCGSSLQASKSFSTASQMLE